MKTMAIVKIGYTVTYLAPTVEVATKIVALISKCQVVEDTGSGYVEVEPEAAGYRFLRCHCELVPDHMVLNRIPKARRLKAPSQEATP